MEVGAPAPSFGVSSGGGPEIRGRFRVTPSPPPGLQNPTFSLSCRILRPCSPTLAPRCPNIARDSQENSILEPKSSNIPPKTLPRQPPGPSGGGPSPKIVAKVLYCWSFLHFGHFSQGLEKSHEKCSQDPPKSSQTEPNMVILALSWPILGATCCQLGPILHPSCAHLRGKSGPNRTSNLKKCPQRPQDHPGGRQRAPGQPLGLEFSWFGGPFWT